MSIRYVLAAGSDANRIEERRLFGIESKRAKFWQWVAKNERTIAALEHAVPEHDVVEEFGKRLDRVDPELEFEFGEVTQGQRELVLSAGGVSARLPSLDALLASAPPLPSIFVVRLRPRRGIEGALEFAGAVIQLDEARFRIGWPKGGGKPGLLLLWPGYDPSADDLFMRATFMLLDLALGEADVMTKVGSVDAAGYDSPHFEGSGPVTNLSMAFDEATAS